MTAADAVDRLARVAWLNGDYDKAVTLVLEAHGSEVQAYVAAVSQPALAADIYGQVALELWSEIERFEWRCALKTYLFTLARHAVARIHKLARRAKRRERRFHELYWSERCAPTSGNQEPAYLRADAQARLRTLRKQLPPLERQLLELRIDRGLSFKDMALIVYPKESQRSTSDQVRLASRLRKRFQQTKSKLRDMFEEDGFLASEHSS